MRQVVIVLSVLLFAGSMSGQAQNVQSRVFKKLMVQKLKSSQELLEGLAMSDFAKMTASAENLLRISSTEEWFAYKTREYRLFSDEFRRSAEKVVNASKEKNLDGATLGYLELTMTCVRCHQYVREIRDVRWNIENDGSAPSGRP